MDRSREARRATMAAANGLSRRRHRSSSLRDSPEEDGPELQETARLRDRGGSGKKDRDRDRDRERDRDRLSRSKRRRADRLLHSREDGGEESSEESVNDEEDDEDDDGAASVRMLPPNPPPLLSSAVAMSNHRKSFPPPAKVFRAAPTWKAADEMIGVSVPRKARSASTKRSHECWASSATGVGAEQIHRQTSTSPVRPSLVSISVAAAPPAPASPSSSNASLRKKMPNGPKLRPPKSSSKSSSSAQDEIEIEIAEVLYGMLRQPQGPSKQEILATDSVKFDPREPNKSGDAKSRVSSPISNSTSAAPQSSSIPPQNSSSLVTPMSAVVAPKRKKPRAVKYDDENPSIFTVRNSPISTTTKAEIDQPAKIEASSSPNVEKKPGSVAENGGVPNDLANPQVVLVSSEAPPESTAKPESHPLSDSKPLTGESEGKDVGSSKEEPQSPKKESPVVRVDDNREDGKANKANSTVSEVENHKEEKFQIDLMAPPPPPLRSSPERDGVIDFVAVDPKSMVTDAETEIKPVVKEDDKAVKICKEEAVNLENEKAKSLAAEEAQSQTPVVARKERNIDLQVDLEKTDRDSGTVSVSGNNKFHHHVQKQQPQHGSTERTAQTSPLPLPISVPGWPGGLPPMGYMAPLQGVVSMDGSTVTPAAIQPPQLLFTQPRPKRCATHCYIARNILYHQQLARMNPFWPAAAGSASLYGAKPCNLNVVPPAELHGNIPGRGVNSAQDKGQGLAMFTGHTGKDKGSQAAANVVDTSQRKQILLQPALPPGAPSNILHGPAFIFPLNQQQPAGAPSARSGSGKSPPAAGSAATSSASNSAAVSASATAAAATAAPMSFNYPNMPGNETQYLAILQNNGYTFPIPAHVGAPPAYRGTHAQAMPFFNGSFYSSPMLHPSHIHHQQQQQQQPPPQSQQSLQAHQNNASVSSGSSSSQKHLQNQQQRPHGNGGAGNVQGFPAPKNQSSQPLQQQQRQQQQNQHVPHQARQLESEMGAEDSPLSADSRVSRANMSIYGQNFAMPIHPPNFGFMNPAMMGGASGAGSASGNHTERKQQHGSKAGVEPPSSQAFPVSFASMNGATTTPGLDISSIAQNHAMFQNNYHIMAAAAAQVAQQKKNYRISEDGKTGGGDSSNLEEERKAMPGKASATVGQSIAFSRPELADASVTTVKGNTVIDSSTRSLNLGSAPGRASGSVMPAAINTVNAPGSQQQLQRNQQQQMIQLKQHQFAVAAATRSKTPVTSNGSVYSDHHLPSSSSMATKFSNLSSFPQNLVQTSSGSPAQSPQWKNSVRTATSQVPSPPLSSSNSSTLKNPLQQQGRTQQSHTQISFGGNAKSSTSQGQPPSSSNQSPSPPVMVGSPTTSSMSKSAGGSPRTTASTSTANKAGQASTLSSQQAKNAPSVPSRKSSPVGGRNVPSILGNHHITSTSDSATKPQLSQQQQQQQQPPQQLPKHIQQAQLFFSNGYIHAQAPHSTGTTPGSPANAYYLQQRNRREQQQQPQGSSGASSTGMLSLCPPLVNTSTSDPTKVAATAGSNMKGGGLPSQGILHVTQFGAAQSPGNPHQLLPAGFSYVRAVPTPVPVKPAEQKQPAGE
ncbi:protein TIME FOR COFFEE isoform X2 [Corylus avellana]|uniref:protein TIME FOR COFFEE isoform X2 n=1 Tax=Corylus avellana TaxID=13451 RepID=UPI00286A3B6F|nr:protein TIME FOR COFFEE isoform X2 [Corylus avellana]